MKKIVPGSFGQAACWLVPICFLLGGCNESDQPLEQIIEQTYPIDPNGSINVAGVDGSFQIYGSSRPEVRLQAIKKAYTAKRLNAISLNVASQPNSFAIETRLAPIKKWSLSDRSGTVDYIMVVPETAHIERLALINGEIFIAGIEGGTVHLQLNNGRIIVRNCFADVHATGETGALLLVYEWWKSRKFEVDARMADGNILATIPSDGTFHLVADAPNGKIGNDFAEQEQRNGATINKIDDQVGVSRECTIRLRADDGNIKIVEANP